MVPPVSGLNLGAVDWHPVLVCALGLLDHEHQKHNSADQWDQCNKLPPAASTGIVEAAAAIGNARDKHDQAEDARQNEGAGEFVDNCQADIDDEVNQRVHPVLGASGSAREVGVVPKCIDEVFHVVALPFLLSATKVLACGISPCPAVDGPSHQGAVPV